MISDVAEKTGGTVEKVNPAKLSENFQNILSNSVIATDVEVKVRIHQALEFRNVDVQDVQHEGSLLVKFLGNVTEDQEMTFEYKLKKLEELAKIDGLDIEQLTSIPFQTQIYYKDLDGNKCVRVLTSVSKITDERKEAEEKANIGVLSVNAAQQAARMARHGDYRGGQASAMLWKKKIKNMAGADKQK